MRAKVGAELTDLRHQQRAFYDNLEKLIDENEVTDEEEQKFVSLFHIYHRVYLTLRQGRVSYCKYVNSVSLKQFSHA